jgi:hypothetical protein
MGVSLTSFVVMLTGHNKQKTRRKRARNAKITWKLMVKMEGCGEIQRLPGEKEEKEPQQTN